MLELQGMKLMHWHGGNDWVEMVEGSGDHDVASHDPERSWLKGGRIYRCSKCEEQVAVVPQSADAMMDEGHPHPAV
jgi:hypothetical protein